MNSTVVQSRIEISIYKKLVKICKMKNDTVSGRIRKLIHDEISSVDLLIKSNKKLKEKSPNY